MLLCLEFFFTSIVKNTQYIPFYEINIYNLTQTNLNFPIHYRMMTSFMYPSKYLKYLLIYTLNITNFFTSSLRKRKINAKKRIHEIAVYEASFKRIRYDPRISRWAPTLSLFLSYARSRRIWRLPRKWKLETRVEPARRTSTMRKAGMKETLCWSVDETCEGSKSRFNEAPSRARLSI